MLFLHDPVFLLLGAPVNAVMRTALPDQLLGYTLSLDLFWWWFRCWLCSRKILSAHTRTWLTTLPLLIHFIQPSFSQTTHSWSSEQIWRGAAVKRRKWGFLRWQSRVLVTAGGREFRPRHCKFHHLLEMCLLEMKRGVVKARRWKELAVGSPPSQKLWVTSTVLSADDSNYQVKHCFIS